MRKLLANGCILLSGVLTADAPVTGSKLENAFKTQLQNEAGNARLNAIREYFAQGDCPAASWSEHFLRAAEKHNLDWRLLPSLAVIESSGGKSARHNNIFGWDNGRARFASAPAAIDHVAATLADSGRYRNKSLDALLRTYNPVVPGYGDRVKSVMMNLGRRAKPSGKNLAAARLKPRAF